MWMSLAPFWIADIRMTFTSLMTGASSPCLASASALISSNSLRTSTSPGSSSIGMFSRAWLATSSALGPALAAASAADAGGHGGLAVVALQRLVDLGLRGHDRLDVVARHELDVVHGEHVGRVGHRDRQRGAGSRERDDLVLLRGLGGHELDDARVDLELADGDRGDAELLAEERGDLGFLDEAERDEGEAELPALLPLVGQRLLELLRGDALLFEKQIAKSDGHLESSHPGCDRPRRFRCACIRTTRVRPRPSRARHRDPPATTCASTKMPERIATLTPRRGAALLVANLVESATAANPNPFPEQPPLRAGGNHASVARARRVAARRPRRPTPPRRRPTRAARRRRRPPRPVPGAAA